MMNLRERFELEGLQKALESVACRERGTGHIVLRENLYLRQGLSEEGVCGKRWRGNCLCISSVYVQ